MELSNLPRDLVEVILSKLPVTSHRAMRLTCKRLNPRFEEKHMISEEEAKESMVMMDYKVYLMDVNLHGIRNIDDLSIKLKGKLVNLQGLDDHITDISQIFHCDGLLLCVTRGENRRLVIWNPCSAETRWIQPENPYHGYDYYAIGYEIKNRRCRINKVLRFCEYSNKNCGCEIYNVKTNTWRFLNTTPPEWFQSHCSVSLKGNTYWVLPKRSQDFLCLTCFDFTKERFGQRFTSPFKCYTRDNVALSSVREEQLVVLIQRRYTSEMEIWVTSIINTETVWWNNKLFLGVDMSLFTNLHFQLNVGRNGFFIDEEKKIVVLLAKNKDCTRHIAYIIGEDGYFREVDLGKVTDNSCESCYVRISKNPKRKQIYFLINALTFD